MFNSNKVQIYFSLTSVKCNPTSYMMPVIILEVKFPSLPASVNLYMLSHHICILLV